MDIFTAIAARPRSASKLLCAASALVKNSSMEVFSVMEVTVVVPESKTECRVDTTKLASRFRSKLRPKIFPSAAFFLAFVIVFVVINRV